MAFNNLYFQALRWTSDGELDPADKLVLLNSLIPQSTPNQQIELIQVVERLALVQPDITLQVTNL